MGIGARIYAQILYIAVLKKVRYWGESYAYARCPMPYEHLMLLRKAISPDFKVRRSAPDG